MLSYFEGISTRMSEAKEKVTLSKSELELGQKWDRCLADAVAKTGSGLGLGVVFSLLFFRRRPWPVILGGGVGIGMAYANCQNELQQPFQERKDVIKVTDPSLIETIKKTFK